MKSYWLLFAVFFLLMACNHSSQGPSAQKLKLRAQLQEMNKQHLASFSKEELEKLEVLDTVPNLSITTLTGKKFSLGKHSQKPTVLLLFATWCPACKIALPEIEVLSKKYKGQVNFLAIGREHSKEDLQAWLEKQDLTIDIAADPERTIYSQFAGWAIPRLYVIDTTGQVAFQNYGWAEYNPDMIQLALASF
ncbi:MAG: TlpA family protein disulfide reductase [Aureispira sp.]